MNVQNRWDFEIDKMKKSADCAWNSSGGTRENIRDGGENWSSISYHVE